MNKKLLCLALFLFGILARVLPGRAQEVASRLPLQNCDRLPVVEATADGVPVRLLVDTAATSLLHSAVFAARETTSRKLSGWQGTARVAAGMVVVGQLKLGDITLADLKLPAVDLSEIGKACGGRIDGILGIDLLGRLRAELDLQEAVLHVRPPAARVKRDRPPASACLARERCLAAFRAADLEALQGCLASNVTLVTRGREISGRAAVLAYLTRTYFDSGVRFDFNLEPDSEYVSGESFWCAYRFKLQSRFGTERGRGMSVYRFSGDNWQLVLMHNYQGAVP